MVSNVEDDPAMGDPRYILTLWFATGSFIAQKKRVSVLLYKFVMCIAFFFREFILQESKHGTADAFSTG